MTGHGKKCDHLWECLVRSVGEIKIKTIGLMKVKRDHWGLIGTGGSVIGV